MKQYEWILFDADETLFHFDAFRGLQLAFSRFGVEFNQLHYQEYQTVNKALWVEYQNGNITASELQIQRFHSWAIQLNISPQQLNSAFLSMMAEICIPLEGAVNLLDALKGKIKMGIITNGFTELQQARLERTGLRNHFDLVVISEQIGIAKPHPGIFEHALALMRQPARDRVLMVGDTLETDILGGFNAGLDTCWLNKDNKSLVENTLFKFKVSSLAELKNLLLGGSSLEF